MKKQVLKKTLSALLVMVLLLSAAPLGGFVGLDLFGTTASAASESDLTFTLINDGTEYEVSGCDVNATGALAIPSTYNGLPVTSIGDDAFYDCINLTSVTIPDGVTDIGWAAFGNCESLTSIIIPDGVTGICMYTFKGCESLISVTIPDSVTSIGESAFYGCTSLTSITIPDGVTIIDDFAFYGCTELTDVYYSGTESQWDDITIGSDNEPLTGATIHFEGTDEPIVDESVLTFTLINDGTEYEVSGCDVNATGALAIPSTYNGLPVTSIGDDAFYDCINLTSVTIPDGVTDIGWAAFGNCESLTSIIIPDGVTGICMYTFKGCESLISVTIPDSVTSIGESAFYGCTSLTSITIPDGVTSIDDFAFYDCMSLTSITIPDSVTSIGSGAFGYCESLTGINIPDGVTNIGDNAFYYCINLSDINIPYGVTSIGDSAFSYCYSLTSITIPDSVTSIGESTFDYCDNLSDVYYTGTESEWNSIDVELNNDFLLNATIHYNYVPICEHSFGEWITVTEPTPDADGQKKRVCSDCGEEEFETIPMLTPVSIEITKIPTNTAYNYKSSASTAGMKVVAKYSDGSERDVTNEVDVTYLDTSVIGYHTAIVEFEGKTDTFGYTVKYAWWQWIIRIVLFGWLWY